MRLRQYGSQHRHRSRGNDCQTTERHVRTINYFGIYNTYSIRLNRVIIKRREEDVQQHKKDDVQTLPNSWRISNKERKWFNVVVSNQRWIRDVSIGFMNELVGVGQVSKQCEHNWDTDCNSDNYDTTLGINALPLAS